MSEHKTVLVVGANGLVGSAVVKHLRASSCRVIATQRKAPRQNDDRHDDRVEYRLADLSDRAACHDLFSKMGEVTHLVYAALYENPHLVSGWSDDAQIRINDAMFKAVLDPLVAARGALRHVTLLQGTKAYGVHVRAIPVPAREDRDELRSQTNFYWAQEAHLRTAAEKAAGTADWGWTILRPTLIVGGVIGGAMNAIPPLCVFASLLKEQALPLAYPGGGPRIAAAVDVDLLARAISWAGDTATARNRTFNVTNGDVYVWENIWPLFAEEMGMPLGTPEPRSINDFCGVRGDLWDKIRQDHQLASPDLQSFVGPSLQYCDYLLRYGQPDPGPSTAVSTIAIQQAGFHDVMDSEDMFRKWIRNLQIRRLIPRP
ncbi:MAG: NAD-dependent epimerase/dehydratase family protein [Pseudomonadota bacterium]